MTYYYTKDHEWVSLNTTIDDEVATVGISDYAQNQLGDVVFVEVPAAGTQVSKGGQAAVVESVKAASDVYSPVSGEVVEGNAALEGDPSLVNSAPENDGWFFKVRIANAGELDGLMNEEAYKAYCDSL